MSWAAAIGPNFPTVASLVAASIAASICAMRADANGAPYYGSFRSRSNAVTSRADHACALARDNKSRRCLTCLNCEGGAVWVFRTVRNRKFRPETPWMDLRRSEKPMPIRPGLITPMQRSRVKIEECAIPLKSSKWPFSVGRAVRAPCPRPASASQRL